MGRASFTRNALHNVRELLHCEIHTLLPLLLAHGQSRKSLQLQSRQKPPCAMVDIGCGYLWNSNCDSKLSQASCIWTRFSQEMGWV